MRQGHGCAAFWMPSGAHLAQALLLAAGLAAGCRDADGVSSTNTSGAHSLAGVVTYDSVPGVCEPQQGCQLDYAAVVRRPVRHAVVQLVDGLAPSPEVLGETTTDASGAFQIDYQGRRFVKVIVLAESQDPPMQVLDNTQEDALFALTSDVLDADAGQVHQINGASGWSGAGYTRARSAAPFAILDVAYEAAQLFAAERTVDFPPLTIYWSEENRPEEGAVQEGQIGTSHWNGYALYLLGKANIDTDEYDTHVVAHEWGHYFEQSFGRADSPGGPHSFDEALDARVAFSEGWCNALSGLVFYPETRYVDTSGVRQADGFYVDMPVSDSSVLDATGGWFSEEAVMSLVIDLFDAETDLAGGDVVSLSVGQLYDVFVDYLANSPAFNTLFSFIDGLKRSVPAQASGIDALVQTYHVDPVTDAYGTGETHDGGAAWQLPLYHPMTQGDGPVQLTFKGSADPSSFYNKLAANRFVRFLGHGGEVTVTATAAGDVDLYLYSRGRLLAVAEQVCLAPPCSEAFTVDTATQEYLLHVQGYHDVEAEYNCSLELSYH